MFVISGHLGEFSITFQSNSVIVNYDLIPELLQQCDSGSREYAEITSEIEHSLWNSKCGLSVTRIETVNNESLSSQVCSVL